MAAQTKWQLSGDYFENCNCDVVCPCLVSPGAPLTARPSQGVCDVALVFHIDKGSYGQVSLDGLNVAVVGHTPGPMGGRQLDARRLYRRARRRPADRGARRDFRRRRGRPHGGLRAVGRHASRREEGADQLRHQRQAPLGGNPRHHAYGGGAAADACIRAARFGRRSAIRSRRTSSRSPWAARAAPSPTTACAGTIPARTATTRRSAGRTRRPAPGSADMERDHRR